jgi:hypothetical protein
MHMEVRYVLPSINAIVLKNVKTCGSKRLHQGAAQTRSLRVN